MKEFLKCGVDSVEELQAAFNFSVQNRLQVSELFHVFVILHKILFHGYEESRKTSKYIRGGKVCFLLYSDKLKTRQATLKSLGTIILPQHPSCKQHYARELTNFGGEGGCQNRM